MPEILTVNIGRPRPNPAKRTGSTGFDKEPVDGPVPVSAPGPKGTGPRASGLAGDAVCDRANHGGDDQAVYAYAREDLDAWERRLDRRLPNGSAFGENLTTRGLDVTGAEIGERWAVGGSGGLLLEVACPRIPCATFAGRMGVPGWIKSFVRAAVPGAYLRVVRPGPVCAGDRVEVLGRPGHGVTIGLALRAVTTDPDLLPRLLDAEAALPAELAAVARRRLPFDLG